MSSGFLRLTSGFAHAQLGQVEETAITVSQDSFVETQMWAWQFVAGLRTLTVVLTLARGGTPPDGASLVASLVDLDEVIGTQRVRARLLVTEMDRVRGPGKFGQVRVTCRSNWPFDVQTVDPISHAIRKRVRQIRDDLHLPTTKE